MSPDKSPKIFSHFKRYWLYPVVELLTHLLPNTGLANRIRGIMIERFLAASGKNLKIARGVRIYAPEKLRVGNHVYIGHMAYLGDGSITLDDEVVIGPFVCLAPSNHRLKNGSWRFAESKFKPIHLNKGVWLGAHVTVTAGVTIKEGVAVGANSVVAKSVSAGQVVVGVPAKPLSNHE